MKRILVVDDQPDCSEPMARLLKLCGFDVRVAANGRVALAELEQFRPDLVLLDLMMPEMDGMGFLKQARRLVPWSQVPVMVFSAYCDDRMREQLDRLGVIEIFGKGQTDFDVLMGRIDACLGAAVAPQRESLRILLVEQDDDTRQALTRLLRDHGYEVMGAKDTNDAISRAASEKFDLTLVDLGLPEQSQAELLRELLSKGPGKSIALASTAESAASVARFTRWIPKPFSAEKLLETIRSLAGT
jgi:CheY-like chemotaxis protein